MSLAPEPAGLTEHLRRLTLLIDHASDAYFVLDSDTLRLVYVNRGACERLGYSVDEFLQLSVSDINPTISDERLSDLIERIQVERIPHYETLHRRKDGTLVPVEVSLTPVVVGGHRLVFAAAREITERKRAQAALAEENRINDVINRVGTLVAAELDRERVTQVVTDAATELTGAQFGAFFYNVVGANGEAYQLYTLSGVSRDAFARFPMPRNTPIFAPTFSGDAVMRLGDVTQDERYGRLSPHYGMPRGHLPVRSYLAVPVKGRAGVIGGLFFGHAQPDVFTERHERIAVGLASWASVAIENARLYTQVKDALEEAHRANQLKDEFLAVLSHELRTPLNAILGWTHLLDTVERDESLFRKAMETIARNAQLQLQLIEDLLDVSAALTGNLHLRLSSVCVGKVVQTAIGTVHPSARAKDIAIVEHIEAPTARVLGDARRLQQIAWNLLSNAIKFTPAGGRVTISVTCVGDDVVIRVEDTGEGIDPSFLPRVFDRFRQGDASATRRHGGLGLGLALVQSFAQAHGGRVDAHSEGKGRGATFTVFLPQQTTLDEAPEIGMPVSASDLPSIAGIQILLVDDDRDTRDVLVSGLQRAGASVRAVSSAQAALDLLLTWRPHVVMSDLAMPDVDGISFLRTLRARPTEHGGDLPVIGMTAYVGLERREEARAAGFERLLSKPVPTEALIQSISEAVINAESPS